MTEHTNPQNINFADRNAVEKFLETDKFRPCANLECSRVPLQHDTAYMPMCLEGRFNRAGFAGMIEMPQPQRPLSSITYTTIPIWAPLVSCPRDCKGYQNRTISKVRGAAALAIRWLFGTNRVNESGTVEKKRWWERPVGIVALTVIAGLILWGITRYLEKTSTTVTEQPKTQPTVSQPPLAILAKCDMVGLPIVIPPHTSLSIVPVNEKRMKATKWGSYDVPNDGDKVDQWPSKLQMKESEKEKNMGVFASKCEISNHSQVNVMDVQLPMNFWFDFKGGDANAVKFTPIISALDAGHSAVLYFVNTCPNNATAVLPDQVNLLVAGDSQRRTTNLELPHRSVIDPIMLWFPTKVRWIGDQCE
jgi:hypothetical protein